MSHYQFITFVLTGSNILVIWLLSLSAFSNFSNLSALYNFASCLSAFHLSSVFTDFMRGILFPPCRLQSGPQCTMQKLNLLHNRHIWLRDSKRLICPPPLPCTIFKHLMSICFFQILNKTKICRFPGRSGSTRLWGVSNVLYPNRNHPPCSTCISLEAIFIPVNKNTNGYSPIFF